VKLQSLVVENFRALRHLSMQDLGVSVVIAGPNGCGKSCALDAIRLVKSAYGGYRADEWQSWYGEFQISLDRGPKELLSLFNDRRESLSIRAAFSLAIEEQAYLHDHAEALLREQIWLLRNPPSRRGRQIATLLQGTELRAAEPEVERELLALLPSFRAELSRPVHIAEIQIAPGQQPRTVESLVLQLVFSLYEPDKIGIIDYHGANRNYNREQLGGINLSIDSNENRLRDHALYNYANKYANLKSEMAAGYIRHLLAKQADERISNDDSLTDALKELFATFFPGKEFLGPRPTVDGKLLFPVRTQSGAEHDIDDLSSGEKEVLYGYLRLRNNAPRNSVILIDEPELHLNPRLIRGLASFYHRRLGRALNSQIWLVTHSDTLIRESVGQADFSVYHMQPAGTTEERNQATSISASEELDRCVIDLVGDMAVYRPGAKLVVFEGGGDTEFDVRMTSTLFPSLPLWANLISGGSKRRVLDLYDLLESAQRSGRLQVRFYAVTDSDHEIANSNSTTCLKWPVYHIENFLLEPCFIRRVLDDIATTRKSLLTEIEIDDVLKDCARETIPDLVSHELRRTANAQFVRTIDLGINPKEKDVAAEVHKAAVRSYDRIVNLMKNTVTLESMRTRGHEIERDAAEALKNGKWRMEFSGRQVLKRFVARSNSGLGYPAFRDLILARMADAEFQPIAMARVVQSIIRD